MLYTPLGVALTKEGLWSALVIPGLQAAIDMENKQQILASFYDNASDTRRSQYELRHPTFTV
jgi:enoyl-CoA hydratase